MRNEEQKKENAGRKPGKGMIVGIVTAVVVVLAVVIAVLMMTMGNSASAESLANCELQAKALAAHQTALETTQANADEAAKITDADAELLSSLDEAQAVVDKLGEAPTCPAKGSQSEVDDAIAAIRDYGEKLREATSSLDAAAQKLLSTASQE